MPDINNLKEERIIWAYGFCLDRTSWQWECVIKENVHLMMGRKQGVRKGLGTRHNFQRQAPGDLLPPIGTTS
jgi:hypothetical protein